MEKYSLSDVFNESNVPVLTFVEPKEFRDIVGSINTAGKHITLSGPSGCGKTTLAQKALNKACIGPGDQIWLSGRDFKDETDYKDIFSRYLSCTKDEGEINAYLQMVKIIIIDDFHHLNENVRNQIALKLKRWNELNIRMFLIGIASSNKDIVSLDPELGIRNDPYEMKTQDQTFIGTVIAKGCTFLHIKIKEQIKMEYVAACKGIPSAIHVICRVACIRSDINDTQEIEKEIDLSMKEIQDGVLRIYKGKYYNKLLGLCKGKQQARSVHNTYFDIIKNIALLDSEEIQIDELQTRIVRSITDSEEKNRKNTSFHNCLNYLPEVINERGLNDAIHYSKTGSVISIEDPSFRLYLSLTDMDVIGKSVRIRKTKYPWDVAVSFAGDDRSVVEQFKNIINDNGYSVFYDFDFQHQLWGSNLRIKLSDVYANQAQYMVIFLSVNYPEKDWTTFELEIGKLAKHKRTSDYLLPIIIDNVIVVGLPGDIGRLDLRRTTIESVAEVMIKKLEEQDGAVN